MIYTKVNKNLYNSNTLKEAKKEYPLYYGKLEAVNRVIERELKTTLEKYPDIDIYISTERTTDSIGRFTNKILRKYKRSKQEFYIVLYLNPICSFYTRHSVKGLKAVLYHEFLHFRQWLLNEDLKHNKGLIASQTIAKPDKEINLLVKQL